MWTSRRLAALASLTAFSIGAYLGLVGPATFPSARFSSFSESGITHASRLLLLDAEGVAHDVGAYERLQCDGYRRKGPEECGTSALGSFSLLDTTQTAAVEARFGDVEGGVAVRLVRRVWGVTDEEVEESDCLVAECRAVPR